MLKLTGSVIHDWGTNTHTSHEDLQYLLELTPKKDVIFIIGDWNEKIGSRRISGITGKFGLGVQNEAQQRLTEFCRERIGHSKQPFPTTQETSLPMNITRWSITKSDYVFCSQRWRSSIQSVKIRPEADYGSDHELLIAKFGLKLKKVGKTTRHSGMT